MIKKLEKILEILKMEYFKLDEDADQITTPEFDLNREKDIREVHFLIFENYVLFFLRKESK